MRLKIGFTNHVEAEFIAEIKQCWIIGVVRSSHSVEVKFLELEQVIAHILASQNPASLSIEIVAIHSINNDGLAIYKELVTNDAHIAKADLLAKALDNYALWIEKFYF